jgi:hypothetical protein
MALSSYSFRIRKRIVIAAGTLFLLSFAMSATAIGYYAYTRPRSPQSQFGLVYPINDHGWIVYGTRFEQIISGPVIPACLFGVVILLVAALRPFNESAFQLPPTAVMWRELIKLPWRYYRLVSSFSPNQIVTTLEAVTAPKRSFGDIRTQFGDFAGTISTGGFRLIPIISYQNSFLPVISGHLDRFATGTQVSISMRPNWLVLLLWIMWMTAAGPVSDRGGSRAARPSAPLTRNNSCVRPAVLWLLDLQCLFRL